MYSVKLLNLPALALRRIDLVVGQLQLVIAARQLMFDLIPSALRNAISAGSEPLGRARRH